MQPWFTFTSLILAMHVMINGHLSKQGICWPVSRDHIAGSSVQLIEVTCFEVDIWPSAGFRLDRGLRIVRKPANGNPILGNPGATSRDDAIFLGESLLQVLKSPWELSLTEPVPEMVKFHSTDWEEKYFSAQSAKSSSRVTLSPSYTTRFSSSINLVAWPVQRVGCFGEL